MTEGSGVLGSITACGPFVINVLDYIHRPSFCNPALKNAGHTGFRLR